MNTQDIIITLVIFVAVFYVFFSDKIAGWLRGACDIFNIIVTINKDERHTTSVSNLPPPSHVLSHSDHEPEPDEDDLRIARNKRMAEMLKPFDRVLIRDDERDEWEPAFFAYYDDGDDYWPFYCTNDDHFAECIPYEGNEHLYLTNEDYDYE